MPRFTLAFKKPISFWQDEESQTAERKLMELKQQMEACKSLVW
jgi:hypothetical protein